MNLLIHRHLPDQEIERFRQDFPQHSARFLEPSEPVEPHLAWAEALLGNPPAEQVLRESKNLKWLQLLSSGFDGYKTLANAPFQVTTAHGIHAPIIAEHCLTTMLMLEARMPFFARRQAERKWDRQARIQGSLRGRRIVILGYGSIAQALIPLLQPFSPKITALTKSPSTKTAPSHLTLLCIEKLDTVLPQADHLILTLPLTSETRNTLSAERLALLPQHAYLHNVGRGPLLDEPALIDALQSNRLAGAALDVFQNESLPPDSPLWSLPNVIVTPHIAGHYRDLDIDVLHLFADNLRRLDNKEPLQNLANFPRGY